MTTGLMRFKSFAILIIIDSYSGRDATGAVDIISYAPPRHGWSPYSRLLAATQFAIASIIFRLPCCALAHFTAIFPAAIYYRHLAISYLPTATSFYYEYSYFHSRLMLLD